MKEFLSSLIRDARRSAGITLRALAEKVGYAPSFLSELENGLRPAPKDEAGLIKLAQALGIEPQKIIEAASYDRERRDISLFKEMLAKDDELAASYCRAKEECNEEELRKMFIEVFTRTRSTKKDA